jgi:hypothetical protein
MDEEENCAMDTAQDGSMAERGQDKDIDKEGVIFGDVRMVQDQVMHGEGGFNQMIMKHLNEMEVIDENGENIWEENEETESKIEGMSMMGVMESLPKDLLPSVQELAEETWKGEDVESLPTN